MGASLPGQPGLRRPRGHLGHAEGIIQFLDLGAGLPTQRAVHETARAVSPDARVCYVDNDPVAMQYTAAVLHNHDRDEVTSFFTGLDVVPPGLAPAHALRSGMTDMPGTPPAGRTSWPASRSSHSRPDQRPHRGPAAG